MDLDDLKDHPDIQDRFRDFHANLEDIDRMIKTLFTCDIYNKLTINEKVDHDLFVVYTFNTLYWMYLRLNGDDPNRNEVKSQLERIKTYMFKSKEAKERENCPKIDKEVATRFIKHGLEYKEEPPNKRKKCEDE